MTSFLKSCSGCKQAINMLFTCTFYPTVFLTNSSLLIIIFNTVHVLYESYVAGWLSSIGIVLSAVWALQPGRGELCAVPSLCWSSPSSPSTNMCMKLTSETAMPATKSRFCSGQLLKFFFNAYHSWTLSLCKVCGVEWEGKDWWRGECHHQTHSEKQEVTGQGSAAPPAGWQGLLGAFTIGWSGSAIRWHPFSWLPDWSETTSCNPVTLVLTIDCMIWLVWL